jgi:hypothetical protein
MVGTIYSSTLNFFYDLPFLFYESDFSALSMSQQLSMTSWQNYIAATSP